MSGSPDANMEILPVEKSFVVAIDCVSMDFWSWHPPVMLLGIARPNLSSGCFVGATVPGHKAFGGNVGVRGTPCLLSPSYNQCLRSLAPVLPCKSFSVCVGEIGWGGLVVSWIQKWWKRKETSAKCVPIESRRTEGKKELLKCAFLKENIVLLSCSLSKTRYCSMDLIEFFSQKLNKRQSRPQGQC